jgi:CMP-2-keto-3-deoxyoctulosonic acid synthetase
MCLIISFCIISFTCYKLQSLGESVLITQLQSIGHLFFADDSLIFSKATNAEVHCRREILSSFEQASGQSINFSKSAIGFNRNTTHDTVTSLSSMWQHVCGLWSTHRDTDTHLLRFSLSQLKLESTEQRLHNLSPTTPNK